MLVWLPALLIPTMPLSARPGRYHHWLEPGSRETLRLYRHGNQGKVCDAPGASGTSVGSQSFPGKSEAWGRDRTITNVRLRKDGTHRHVSLTVSPIRDGTGTVIGASTIARDITALKRDQDTQRASLRFIEFVQEQREISSLLEAFVSESKDLTGCEHPGEIFSSWARQCRALKNYLDFNSCRARSR